MKKKKKIEKTHYNIITVRLNKSNTNRKYISIELNSWSDDFKWIDENIIEFVFLIVYFYLDVKVVR